jgi:hypothetical protein
MEKTLAKQSQAKKVVEFLKCNANQKFNVRQIAEAIIKLYPDDYTSKRQNPRFKDDKSFVTQIVSEIGAHKNQISRIDKHVFWQDKPRPRIYWYNPDKKVGDTDSTEIDDDSDEVEISSLHGIGVILLNPENPSESDMMLPSKTRPEVDWQSVNRILVENTDFKDYIELVSTYYQTGRVRARDWNKP